MLLNNNQRGSGRVRRRGANGPRPLKFRPLVPITPGYLIRDLAIDLGLPLVIAARTGLGTINHTLLTLEAARAVALDVRAVVLTPWPEAPSALERSNRTTIEHLGGVAVRTLARIERPDVDLLAAAGAALI